MKRAVFFFFLFGSIINAQNNTGKLTISDAVQQKSYFQLYDLFFENLEKNPEKALVYASTYLQKGKEENKKNIISHGYFLISHLYKDQEEYVKYADSIIYLNKDSKGNEYPARGFLLKGEHYLSKKRFADAFENYKIANTYATRRSNARILYHSNRAIAKLKNRAGKHKHAIKIFKDCYKYASENEIETQREDLLLLANELVMIDSLEAALKYAKKGIQESLRAKDEKFYNLFVLQSGMNLFYQKEYKKSIDSITKSLVYLENANTFDQLITSYYYLGKSYWVIEKRDRGVSYFKKMDSVAQIEGDILSHMLMGYTTLNSYYTQQKNLTERDRYLVQQAKVDSLLKNNITNKLISEIERYETFPIITKKDNELSELDDEIGNWRLFFVFAFFVFVVCISVIIYLVKDRNRYQKSFRAIVSHTNKGVDISEELKEEKEKKLSDLNISPEVIKKVLKGLDEFEKKERYLNKKCNLGGLAKELHTNSSYLSKIINISKGKNFASYLQDLRVGHTIERLKDDRQFRLFSIKGISEEVGFKSSESFSKAFHKKTGIYPSSFISKLKQT